MDLDDFEALYTAAQTRALDSCAINDHQIPGITLMSRAAEAAFDCLIGTWAQPECVQVLCGTGNNGGDGYLVADLAHKRGIKTTVLQLGDADKIGGDALLAREQALANGVEVIPFDDAAVLPIGVVVDALLGTGLGGDVRGDYAEAIAEINAAGTPVLAVDIPSGLCADTGRVLGTAVRADLTVTFIGLKRGLFALQAPDYTGELQFAGLGVPAQVYRQVPADCFRLQLEPLLDAMPPRPATAHKGLYGTVLVIGGDYGMAGAAALAAEAALRCGAGLVRVATRPQHVAALVARTPEIMPVGVESGADLQPLLDSADTLVVGPGLGQSPWSEYLLQAALASGKPMVLDADGLNLLAAGKVQPRPRMIVTPHPGEAARLLGVSTAEVQADRFAATSALQQKLGGVVVLKGNGSLIASEKEMLLSDYGNPGMASGGMGDVLSGVIGALLAQGQEPLAAAALGVCLHGAAADIAAEEGMRGLVATDLMPWLRELLG
ncbi:bifunctional ADP-dependent NAD(P)H-hydrate dehydratase/NAD(P)H-hydrate epimerase [Pseudohalioglobus lutimaris]|uniref:Bifunctional NAD(P)H-hydrate repair enzyme n=1 Tax=Pseudohalioglobus lutimaris TaxID=1737061 RepID=A0A2N5X1M8_9GAMM|nr:bifunctional ADP-dependent NAD(P)H-hydrate dehydratase/NAD(P)H-hydrate epimerase [Pseudohalioglobus lutimaris]PLW68388.1 bifunctional ADP-dependent NAD(P)H-hydrate dehydratase/NAD(P)H-hydrate epimerase [Pseudohalioglobus lutimaris]